MFGPDAFGVLPGSVRAAVRIPPVPVLRYNPPRERTMRLLVNGEEKDVADLATLPVTG